VMMRSTLSARGAHVVIVSVISLSPDYFRQCLDSDVRVIARRPRLAMQTFASLLGREKRIVTKKIRCVLRGSNGILRGRKCFPGLRERRGPTETIGLAVSATRPW
jgi:hypothetical protein